MKKLIWARIALIILTLGGLFSLYQVAFDAWMTAYPFADPHVWRTRLYIRFATTVMIGILWITLAIWLYRRNRPLNLASDKNLQSLGRELAEFIQYIIPDEEPAFVSDEATVWDISLSTQEELIGRCLHHYGVELLPEDLKMSLSHLLPELQRRRTK